MEKGKIPCESMLRLPPKKSLPPSDPPLAACTQPIHTGLRSFRKKPLQIQYFCLWACLYLQTWRRKHGGDIRNWETWLRFCCCWALHLLTQVCSKERARRETQSGVLRTQRCCRLPEESADTALPAQASLHYSPKPERPRATWQLELLKIVWATVLGVLHSHGVSVC